MAANTGCAARCFNGRMDTSHALLPTLYISHGSPMTALDSGADGVFWRRLGPAITQTFGRPAAILAISAHSLTREPLLLVCVEQLSYAEVAEVMHIPVGSVM